jgi:hypothetical protein
VAQQQDGRGGHGEEREQDGGEQAVADRDLQGGTGGIGDLPFYRLAKATPAPRAQELLDRRR